MPNLSKRYSLVARASLFSTPIMHLSDAAKFAKDSHGSIGQQLRLRSDSRQEILVGEAARLIEHGGSRYSFAEIASRSHASLGAVWRASNSASIEMKLIQHNGALAMVPAIGQQDTANIEEDYVEGEHRRLHLLLLRWSGAATELTGSRQ